MAMQEFRVPTSYKVDVDTVDRSIEGASIVASGTRQLKELQLSRQGHDRCCLS